MNLKIIFSRDTNLHTFTSSGRDEIMSWMPTKILGHYLVMRNISIFEKICKVKSIMIPKESSSLKGLFQHFYPSIDVIISSEKDGCKKSTNYKPSNLNLYLYRNLLSNSSLSITKATEIIIPLNSILLLDEMGKLVIDLIRYPWDFLNSVQKILENEVTSLKIDHRAKISKTAIIEGPCVIEKGVVIDDFCKIKGPAYIGENSFIGMGSLVRNSILEHNTKVGFNCEIGKSYFSGNDKISHHNVILDSIVGQNVWFGGYSGTANVLLDRRNVKYKIDDTFIDTGTDHFGSVIEDNCCIGASVIILPGRRVCSNTHIQAGTIFRSQREAMDLQQRER
jgi:acetyltransferase-like isoleucine patch superfamily enzyme